MELIWELEKGLCIYIISGSIKGFVLLVSANCSIIEIL